MGVTASRPQGVQSKAPVDFQTALNKCCVNQNCSPYSLVRTVRNSGWSFCWMDACSGEVYLGVHAADGRAINIRADSITLVKAAAQIDNLEADAIEYIQKYFPTDLARMVLQYTGMFGKLEINGYKYQVVDRIVGSCVLLTSEHWLTEKDDRLTRHPGGQHLCTDSRFLGLKVYPKDQVIMMGVIKKEVAISAIPEGENRSSECVNKCIALFKEYAQLYESEIEKCRL